MTDRPEGHRAVLCRVGSHEFVLASSAVREVCTDLALVRMPGVASPVEGVVNLRGTLVTVVRVGGDTVPSAWYVVVEFRDRRVALGVDEVIDFVAPPAGLESIDVEKLLEPVFGRASVRDP